MELVFDRPMDRASVEAALVAGGKAADLINGARLAEEVIDSGRAREKLRALIDFTQKLN